MEKTIKPFLLLNLNKYELNNIKIVEIWERS